MNDLAAFKCQLTVPMAQSLVAAVAADDADSVARILADVAFPEALAVILAAAVDPLLLEDADFREVQYDHPALSYHAGRYENGDRDMLARRCYVHRQSIPAERLAISTSAGRGTR